MHAVMEEEKHRVGIFTKSRKRVDHELRIYRRCRPLFFMRTYELSGICFVMHSVQYLSPLRFKKR